MSKRPSQTGPAGLAALCFFAALAAACQGPAPAPTPTPAPAAVDPAEAARQKRITRAKARLDLYGDRALLAQAVRKKTERYSGLAERLGENHIKYYSKGIK